MSERREQMLALHVRPPRARAGAGGRIRRRRDRHLDLDPARSTDPGWRRALVGDGVAPAARRSRPGRSAAAALPSSGPTPTSCSSSTPPGAWRPTTTTAPSLGSSVSATTCWRSPTSSPVRRSPWSRGTRRLASSCRGRPIVGPSTRRSQLLRQEWTQYAKGTRLDEALPTMRQLLPRSGPDGGYDIVFFLSDGEQTEQPAPQSFERLDEAVAGGAVLGYGTAEGARMHVYVGRDENPELYIHDYDSRHRRRVADRRSRTSTRSLTRWGSSTPIALRRPTSTRSPTRRPDRSAPSTPVSATPCAASTGCLRSA